MNKLSFKFNFAKAIRHIYYYVPPCPCCKSFATGRIVKIKSANGADAKWQMLESLKHGELVKTVDETAGPNCFCLNCGYQWDDVIETKFLNNEQLLEEKKKRATIEILNEIKKAERDEQESYKKNHPVVSKLKNFLPRF